MATAENANPTPEELLSMPDVDRYEIVAGQLVDKEMGWEASLIATIVSGLIGLYDPDYLSQNAGAIATTLTLLAFSMLATRFLDRF